jgi:hypothetical protein
MITNTVLGSSGRLGNQMFQYAMLVGIKHKLGFDVILDEDLPKKSIYGTFELTNCFQLHECHFFNKRDIYAPIEYKEERFEFQKRFFKNIVDGTNFEGYFQSEKYFEHCKDIIRKEFTFRPHILDEAKKIFEGIDKETVSIHVRRGDYVNLPNHHPLCSVDYYKEAIQQFDSDVHFIVLSDDVTWCKENLQLENCTYSENSTAVDLCIMTLCNHNIIANSSYSWWGTWLNAHENKKVVMPKKWFGPFYNHYDTSDLYLNNWTVL